MTNPFSGIITSEFKQLFDNAISALLYNDALTLPCTVSYGVTRWDSCENCVYDAVGQKSSNRYLDGGPVPFPFGSTCPMCDGQGRHPIVTTENINLAVIWDSKKFINVGTVASPNGMIQTLTFSYNIPILKRAKELIVATGIANYGDYRYERASEPDPCGLGNTTFVHCLWKRI